MADKYVQYGDKRFKLDEGMTLDQARDIMARHFPELADPDVKTSKDGDDTVYTFAKKAGRKGNGVTAARARLLRVPARPIRPEVAEALAGQIEPDGVDYGQVELELFDWPMRVASIRGALNTLPPAFGAVEVTLL